MQDRVMVSSDKIQAIAAAINEKTGNNMGMTLEEMADAINNLNVVNKSEEDKDVKNLYYHLKGIRIFVPNIIIHEIKHINIADVIPFN